MTVVVLIFLFAEKIRMMSPPPTYADMHTERHTYTQKHTNVVFIKFTLSK